MASGLSRQSRLPRRDSSPAPRTQQPRRPQAVRACTTEPSITMSNAWRDSVMTGTTVKRSASELLNRVWLIVNPPSEQQQGSAPAGAVTGPGGAGHTSGVDDETKMERSEHVCLVDEPEEDDDTTIVDRSSCASTTAYGPSQGAYFSFPSFDTWEEMQQQRGHGNAREIPT